MVERFVLRIIAVFILIVSASFSGCLSDEDQDSIREIEFSEPDFFSTSVNGSTLWNVELSVTDATFEDIKNPDWSDVSVSVTSIDGAMSTGKMNAQSFPDQYPEDPGAYYVSRGVAFFSEDVDDIDLGDSLHLIGLDERFMGGTLRILWKDDTVSTITLPGDFTPKADITCKEPTMTVAVHTNIVTWSSEFFVDDVDSNNTRLLWYKLRLGILDAEGNVLVDPDLIREDPGASGYDDDNDGIVNVEFWYMEKVVEDWPRRPFTMDEEDGIKITGLSRDYQGDIVVLFKGEDPIWSSDPIPQLPEVIVEIVLGSTVLETNRHNGTESWVVSIPIMDIVPMGDPILWEGLIAEAVDPNNLLLFNDSIIALDEGVNTTEPGRWYIEIGDGDGFVSIGDTLVITGIDGSFVGARIGLYRNGILCGFATLPSTFGPEIELTLSTIDYHEVGPGIVFDVWFNVTSVIPIDFEIGWDDLLIGVINRTSQIELRLPTVVDGEYDGGGMESLCVYYYGEGIAWDLVLNGDQILFYGVPTSYDSATVELYLGDDLVGKVKFPHLNILDFINIALPSPYVSSFQIDPDGIPDSGDEYYVYDMVFAVDKIIPSVAKVYWENLSIEIVHADGTILLPTANMMPNTDEYDRDGSDGIEPECWFINVKSVDDRCRPADAIKITGLSDDYKGATMRLYYHGEHVGSCELPSAFP
jgi:hypothetical protein